MRIEQLRYLIEVEKTHSMNVAAANLYVTQPTISEALKKLETELGVELIRRSYTGVQLTEAGLLAAKDAKAVIRDIDVLLGHVETFMRQKRCQELAGELRVGAVTAIAGTFFPDVVTQFCQRYPKISLSSMEQGVQRIYEDIQNEALDIGVVIIFEHDYEAHKDEGIVFEALSHERAYAIVSTASVLAEKDIITPKELVEQPLVVAAHDVKDNYLVEALFQSMKPQVRLRTNNSETVRSSILTHHMVGLILSPSLKTIEMDKELLKAIPIKGKSKAMLGYIYKENSPVLEAVEAFVDILKSNI